MKKSLLISILLLSVLGLTSCAKKAETKTTKLRVSYFPTAIYDSLLELADAKGWFKEEGLDVEAIAFTKGPEVNDAIISGDIDIGYAVGDQPFIAQAAREPGAVIISEASLQYKNQGLAVREDIKSVEDLKGKKVAVLIGTMYHKQFLAILKDHGLTENDVELVNIFGNEAYTALSKGEIHGYEYGNAWTLKQLESFGAHSIQTAEVSPGRAVTYTTRKFAEAHSEEVTKFLKVLYKAEDYIRNNPEDSYKTIAEYLNYSVDQVRTINNNNIWTTGISPELVSHLEGTYLFLKDKNFTKAELSDFEKYIDDSYVKKAKELYSKEK